MSEKEAPKKPQKLNLPELVKSAKGNHAEAFGEINDKRGLTIAKALLAELGKQIAAIEEGSVNVPGFGKFTVKRKTIEKDGQKVVRRRVVFRKSAK